MDANVLISAAVKRGFTLDLLYSENLELFCPEYTFKEIELHEEEILEKSGLHKSELLLFFDIIRSRIKIVASEELKQFIEDGEKITPDTDDAPYFALALKLSCGIWSNDKRLKKQSAVNVLSTEDVAEFLNSP